jgi:hypothetical protein
VAGREEKPGTSDTGDGEGEKKKEGRSRFRAGTHPLAVLISEVGSRNR